MNLRQTSGPGARTSRRSRGAADQSAAARRAVHRRDPSPLAGGRRSAVSGDGGFPARHHDRRRSGGAFHQAGAAAVHADRRDHARGSADLAAARSLRHRAAARVLHDRRARAHRDALGRHPRRAHRRRRARRASRSARAARRASPTACCAGCATTPRSRATAASTRRSRARRSICSRSTRRASMRWIASCSPPSSRSSTAGRWASRASPAAIGEERGTLEDVIEPFLIQQGFLMRTARGRMATRNAYLHFGLKVPERAHAEPAAVRGRAVKPRMTNSRWRTRASTGKTPTAAASSTTPTTSSSWSARAPSGCAAWVIRSRRSPQEYRFRVRGRRGARELSQARAARRRSAGQLRAGARGARVDPLQAGHSSRAETDATLLAEGEVRVVCVDAKSFRPRRLPDFIQKAREGSAMDNELSIVRLVLNASIPVQVVMGLLLLASLLSWTIIFRKRSLLSRAHDEAENFENSFWKGGDLTALYRQIESRGGATGMSSIFEFGFREFARLKQSGIPAGPVARGRAPRDARRPAQGDRAARGEPREPRHHRLDQSLRGSVRHGVGHHEFLRRAGRRAAGHAAPWWRPASPRR